MKHFNFYAKILYNIKHYEFYPSLNPNRNVVFQSMEIMLKIIYKSR